MLTLAPVTDGLPDGADTGFRLMDGSSCVAFFHWDSNHNPWAAAGTSYADVLTCLPDRLAEQGYDDQVTKILGMVVNKYGAGS